MSVGYKYMYLSVIEVYLFMFQVSIKGKTNNWSFKSHSFVIELVYVDTWPANYQRAFIY